MEPGPSPTRSSWCPGLDGQAGDRRAGPRAGPVGVARRGRGQAGREHDGGPDRPDRLDPLRRPAGQLQLAETRETGGQLAEAADLYKKAAGEAAGKPFVLQTALYREAAALGRPGARRARADQGRQGSAAPVRPTYPNSRHIIPAREDLARLQLSTGDFAAAEATIAELAKLPKAGDRAAVLRAKLLAKQGSHDEAVSELDRLIATLPDRSVRQREARLAKAESLVGHEEVQGGRGPGPRR